MNYVPKLAFSQERGATSASKSDAVLSCGAAPSIVLDEGPRLSCSAHGFFRAVRVFLFGLVDRPAFQEVSLGRKVSITSLDKPARPLGLVDSTNNISSQGNNEIRLYDTSRLID